MNHRTLMACTGLVALSTSTCVIEETPAPPAASDKTLVLLFTSDEHSHLFAFSPERDDFPANTAPGSGALVGGVARRATVLARERAAAKDAKKATLTVSAGDNQMGCLPHLAFETASIDYATMADLGYDVTTLGNHELDFGPTALAHALDAAKANGKLPPIVATNIKFDDASPDDDALAAHYSADVNDDKAIHPYRVVKASNGLRVGFIGYLGVNASSVAPNKAPVHFSERGVDAGDAAKNDVVLPRLYDDLRPVVETLRAQEKVDLVVALSHAGVNDSSTDAGIAAGEDTLIGENVPGIDVIISGHAHNPDPRPILVKNSSSGRDVLVLNASAYGQVVGRVELTVPADKTKAPTYKPETQTLIPVDDRQVPDAYSAGQLGGLVSVIEKSGPGGKSTLAALLSRGLGAAVADDPDKAGDLYFHPVGATSFDVTATPSLLYLSADAMLTVADAASKPADMGLESAGVIRGVLKKGQTGVISAADAFNIVPLGRSPVDGTLGYPLVRVYLSSIELRGIFEFSLSLGKTNTDYLLGQAGVKVEYDATRPLVQSPIDLFSPAKGQVMRILLDTDHKDGLDQFDAVIYDRAQSVDLQRLYSVVTSSYVAAFAASVGVSLKDDKGTPVAIEAALLRRADGSEIKEIEGFFGYLKGSPGGTLPSLYDATSPGAARRLVCTGGC